MKRLAIAAALLLGAPAFAADFIQQSPVTFNGVDFVNNNGVIGLAVPGGGGAGITALTGDCSASGTGSVPITCAFPAGVVSSATNPTVSGDLNNRYLASFSVNYDNALNLNTGFTNASGLAITETARFGLNSYGNGTNAKWTFLPFSVNGNYTASGQRFLLAEGLSCWGSGDCFGETKSIAFWGADIAGDEGQGFQSVSYLTQAGRDNGAALSLTTINATPTTTTCSTTTTQAITGSQTVQTVTVTSTTGCAVGNWMVVNSQQPTVSPNYEAVQITAVGVGTISGVFRLNQTSGVTLRPAKVLPVADTNTFGQGRMLVNMTAPSYSTGTVSSISGGGFTGTGTGWTTGMVGDNGQPNVGCIALVADDYSGVPFNGSGNHGTLHSWYAITGTVSATGLGIFTTSVAGDGSYHGYGPGSGTYQIRPCAEVLQVFQNSLILMPSAAPWANGDTVEQAITPFPDVSGHMEQYAVYTAGGALRAGYSMSNVGRRKFDSGISITANMPTAGDVAGWSNGISVDHVETGVLIRSSKFGIAFGDSVNEGTDIVWGGGSGASRNQAIGYASVNGGDALMLHSGNGALRCQDAMTMCLGLGLENGSNQGYANWNGSFALFNTHNGGRENKIRFYDNATFPSDPKTATGYIDIRYAYPGSAIGDYRGLSISDGTTELMKLDWYNTEKVTITGKLETSGNSTFKKYIFGSISLAVSATGTTFGGAVLLTSQTNIVTVAPAGSGVRLPAIGFAPYGTVGGWIDVYNDGPANAIKVYTEDGDQIDGVLDTTGVSLTNGFWARFISTAPHVWKSYRFPITRSS